MWYQNRDNPAVWATVDRTIPEPDGKLDVRLYLRHLWGRVGESG